MAEGRLEWGTAIRTIISELRTTVGGGTSVSNSIALYDRLDKDHSGFVEGCSKRSLVYQIPHNTKQVGGIVGGDGLYKDSAFGPKEGKRVMDEQKILDLVHGGGWPKDINRVDENLPVWQRRGFNWL